MCGGGAGQLDGQTNGEGARGSFSGRRTKMTGESRVRERRPSDKA